MKPLAAFLALLLLSVSAQAQSMCLPYAVMVKTLKEKYGEVSLGKGVQAESFLIEILLGPETFTILRTDTSGRACMIAAGKGWVGVHPQIQGNDT